MDMMEVRRRVMLSMASGQIPKYLKHFSFTPTEDAKSLTLEVGEGVTYVVLTSNCPSKVSVQTVISGIIFPSPNGGTFANSVNKIVTRTINKSFDYWQPTSSTHVWTYSDGIINITWKTDYYVGAGIQYDVFYM